MILILFYWHPWSCFLHCNQCPPNVVLACLTSAICVDRGHMDEDVIIWSQITRFCSKWVCPKLFLRLHYLLIDSILPWEPNFILNESKSKQV